MQTRARGTQSQLPGSDNLHVQGNAMKYSSTCTQHHSHKIPAQRQWVSIIMTKVLLNCFGPMCSGRVETVSNSTTAAATALRRSALTMGRRMQLTSSPSASVSPSFHLPAIVSVLSVQGPHSPDLGPGPGANIRTWVVNRLPEGGRPRQQGDVSQSCASVTRALTNEGPGF